jgi:hypothetical protein
MRCADLNETWNGLRAWLDATGVLVLPPLEGARPSVRLDADVHSGECATHNEMARVLDRLRALVHRFDVRAVYAGRTHQAHVLTSVTVRIFAGGVVHELSLVSAGHTAVREQAPELDGAFMYQ